MKTISELTCCKTFLIADLNLCVTREIYADNQSYRIPQNSETANQTINVLTNDTRRTNQERANLKPPCKYVTETLKYHIKGR